MIVYIITAVILLIYFVLVYFLGAYFGSSTQQWIFRGCFWVLGLIAAGAFLFLHLKRSKKKPAPGAEIAGSDIDNLMRAAESRLSSSRAGKGAKFENLPMILIVGPAGGAKTTTVVNSGVEPQLLAGHVNDESTVAPTRVGNVWIASDTILLEAGTPLTSDADFWSRVMRRLRPSRLRSAFGRSSQAPRAVLVCVDTEALMQAGAGNQFTAVARNLRERLSEAARTLGINLPVYVLFTKIDRISFFTDYVRNLTNEEASTIVGATLPLRSGRAGVYAEEETKRVTYAFQNVFYELAEKRLMMLAREQQEDKLPPIYEFPREFRKLQSMLTPFLIELCRPSQIDTGPFLRGFYFSGVRPVIVDDPGVSQAAQTEWEKQAGPEGATRLFGGMQAGSGAAGPSRGVAQARKVPQWVFLPRLFHDILFRDRSAKGSSTVSSAAKGVRRLLLAAAMILILIAFVGTTWSYFNNSDLEDRANQAARSLQGVKPAPGVLPTIDQLKNLDVLRQVLIEILRYQQEGPPLSYRWGLYTGDKLYEPLYRVYFDRFRDLLLDETQMGLATDLRGLPAEPSPAFPEGPTYDRLRAYVITADLHQCSTREVVSPVLLERWTRGRAPAEDQLALASMQFDFYSEMLRPKDPYNVDADGLAVSKGRQYLSKFTGVERLYRSMVADASAKFPSVMFNRDVPGSQVVIVNTKEVPGAFTKDGWGFVQANLGGRGAATGGEGCDALVMGEFAVAPAELANAGSELLNRYRQEYFDHWLAYLNATRVNGYGSAADAASKLEKLSGAQSPLLALFALASTHTGGGPPEVRTFFQPPQQVVPPESGALVADSNKGYLTDLFNLQDGWSSLAKSPLGAKDSALVDGLFNTVRTAKANTNQMSLSFQGDVRGAVASASKKTLMDPIEHAEQLLFRLGTLDLNKQGKGLCDQFSLLRSKYPFDPRASQEASLDEVTRIFHPQSGALWNLYNAHLIELLVDQGGQYRAKPGGTVNLNPAFIDFFNRAAAVSRAFYPGNSLDLRFVYKVTPQPVSGFERLQLNINGQSLVSTRQGGTAVDFTWPGDTANGVQLFGLLDPTTLTLITQPVSPWAVFRFFAGASTAPASGNGIYEWRPETAGQPMYVGNTPVVVRYHLDHGGNPAILKPGFLSTLSCVSQVSR